MRAVIQKVTEASVTVNGEKISEIGKGLMILLGVEDRDNDEDLEWLTNKLTKMRIFEDEEGVMNKSVTDENGEVMVISQFTLMASTKKGNRPSYIRASKGEIAEPMYEKFCETLSKKIGKEVKKGMFGAMMEVRLLNYGPTTIVMDTQNRDDW